MHVTVNAMHSQGDRGIRQLWGLDDAPSRGPKARWSAAQLAACGVELADEAGLDGVSLAKVAERLGMTTTAVYRYVESKAELVELMVDEAVGDPPPLHGDDWCAQCRSWATLLAERYAAHSWLSEIRPQRMPTAPRAYAWIDALVAAVEGRTTADPLRLALLLDGLVRSYAALGANAGDAAPAWLQDAVADRFPRLAAGTARAEPSPRDELAYAVGVVLDGLDGLDGSHPPS